MPAHHSAGIKKAGEDPGTTAGSCCSKAAG